MILGVLSQDDADPRQLQPFIRENKMTYPVLRHAGREDARTRSVRSSAFPTSFLIGRDGAVCAKQLGPVVEGGRRSGRSRRSCSMIAQTMLKGFTHARLACGCRIGFRDGVEGSPVTVVVDRERHRAAR